MENNNRRSFKLLRYFCLISLILLGTLMIISSGGGGGGGGDDTENQTTDENEDENAGGDINTMQFTTFSYVDQDAIGIEAFSMIIPEEWSFTGGIEWIFDNPGAPAVTSFTVGDPDGHTELELLPAQSFFSTQDAYTLSLFPVGSEYYGNEVRAWPPLGPLNTLKDVIIPRFRGTVTNLQIITEEALPEITTLLRAGISQTGTTTLEAAKIRTEYEQDGVSMEEEIYCVVETAPVQGLAKTSLWMADFLFSFKAEKGALDSQYKIFQTIMYSFRLNPQWFNKYVQLIAYLVQQQIEIIQSYGQISQIISQTSDEISDMVTQSYNNHNAACDRMAENFSDYILGTDTYLNPADDTTVKLPSGYSEAWTNNLGGYILSDNVLYDPNIELNETWQKMTSQ